MVRAAFKFCTKNPTPFESRECERCALRCILTRTVKPVPRKWVSTHSVSTALVTIARAQALRAPGRRMGRDVKTSATPVG